MYQQASTIITLPPPVGGWNARDSVSAMQPNEAITLDNYVPGLGGVRSRKGFTVHATGLSNYVETLMEYNSPGNEKLFAISSDGSSATIYNITDAGTASSVSTPGTSARWQHTMLANAAGHFLLAVGSNRYFSYDGSAFTDQTAAVLGASATNFSNITVHAERVWFVKDASLDSYYLNVASITGTATKFGIGSFCRRGGKLVAMGSWTRDGGSGPDDILAFVTSKGEVVLYSGTDPNSPTTFSRIGTFNIPYPVGPRCLVKIGAELAILTVKGVLPLSQVMPGGMSAQLEAAYTDKIRNAYDDAVLGSRSDAFGTYKHGWQCLEYPKRGLLIVNYPVVERATQRQFIMNVNTGAWSRWLDINAGCWGLLGDSLYFGGNGGKVYAFDTADIDNSSAAITTRVQLAYTDCGAPGVQKRFLMARALMRLGTFSNTPTVEIKTDYDLRETNQPAPLTTTGASLWDVALWDVALWGDNATPRLEWQTINGQGVVVSVGITAQTSTEMELNTTDVIFERGGPF